MTICLFSLCSALNVWKNSAWVDSFFSRNWRSSTSRTSISRYLRFSSAVLRSWIALMTSLVNSSVLTYRTRDDG